MTAVAGLGMINHPEAEVLIKEVHGHTNDEDLKRHCTTTVAKRRRTFGGPAHG